MVEAIEEDEVIVITLPVEAVADLVEAIQVRYGAETSGMNAQQLLVHHLRVTLGPLLQAHRRDRATQAAEQAADASVRGIR